MSSEAARNTSNQAISKLWVDILIFAVFLITMEPRLSRLPVHEWLSLSMIFGMTVHLLINWDWVAQVSQRFLGRLGGQTRINYILNWLFFIDGTLIIVSGVMISEVAMPALGLDLSIGRGWGDLHELSTNLALILLGLHTALHWSWIVNTVNRYMIQPVLRLFLPENKKDGIA
ncbi:MAG: DUF4405 domain-containing protein [Chloroflexota bacterium]|jgi:hypothetical protein